MKNKYFIIISVVVVLLASALIATLFLKSEDATVVAKEAAKKEEVLRQEGRQAAQNTVVIGVDSSFVPVTFANPLGEMLGYDVDLATAVLKKMGKEVRFRAINWADKDELLNAGEIDLIWSGLTLNDDKKVNYAVSDAYTKSLMLAVVANSSTIRTDKDFGGKVAGVRRVGGYVTKMLKQYRDDEGMPLRDIKVFGEASIGLSGLLTGDADFVLMDEIQANYYMKNTPDTFRKVSFEALGSREMVVVAKKGNTDLINQINSVLSKMKNDGTMARIESQWFAQ